MARLHASVGLCLVLASASVAVANDAGGLPGWSDLPTEVAQATLSPSGPATTGHPFSEFEASPSQYDLELGEPSLEQRLSQPELDTLLRLLEPGQTSNSEIVPAQSELLSIPEHLMNGDVAPQLDGADIVERLTFEMQNDVQLPTWLEHDNPQMPQDDDQEVILRDAVEQLLVSDEQTLFHRRYPFVIVDQLNGLSLEGSRSDRLSETRIFRIVGAPSAIPGIDVQRDALEGRPISFSIDRQAPNRTVTVPAEPPIVSERLGIFASVGMIVDRASLEFDGENYVFKTASVRTDGRIRVRRDDEPLPICERDRSGEPVQSIMSRFDGAPRYTGAACSGFLAINDQNFIAAKHCVLTLEQNTELFPPGSTVCPENTDGGRQMLADFDIDGEHLSGLVVLFGFKVDQEGHFPTEFPQDQVYAISGFTEAEEASDLISLRLDRPVPADVAAPLSVGARSIGEWLTLKNRPLVFASHSLGLPLVLDYDSVGVVDEPSVVGNASLFAGADSYAGGSGGPLIDLESGQVIGILVCGQRDYRAESIATAEDGTCLLPRVTHNAHESVQQFLHLNSVLP